MKKVIVLGGGLVGGPMALDLSQDGDMEVTVCDVQDAVLEKFGQKGSVQTIKADLRDRKALESVIEDQDIVLNAVPGFMGFETLKTVIESEKNAIDIAFYPEDLFELDNLAKEKNVSVIADMGVAPGMSNLLTGYASHLLDEINRVQIYVGGLPKIRQWPYEYKAVFSPSDVIEEYTRPARIIENGEMVLRPALSQPELLEFDGIGTLEAFNSDGLRSLAKTIAAKDMIEKTLRYPGHAAIMKIFQQSGFFSKNEVEIGDMRITPLEFTSKLLFPIWKLQEGEEDITVMKIIVEGKRGDKQIRHTWNLIDGYDPVLKVHSMARTTGYAATTALRLLLSGLYARKGVSPPEWVGKHPDCVAFMLEGLKEKNIHYHHQQEIL
jgi:saccharopine dehydrogenase-like NADP-dependent oxidoreductase